MKNKYFKLLFLGVISFFIFPLFSSAEVVKAGDIENTPIYFSPCAGDPGGGTKGLYNSAAFYTTINPNCMEDYNPNISNNNGIAVCAQEGELRGASFDAIEEDITSEPGKKIITHYFVARIDAWSDKDNEKIWGGNAAFNNKRTCPTMRLNYETTSKHYIIDQYKNQDITLLEMDTWTLNDPKAKEIYDNYSNSGWTPVSGFLSKWGIKNNDNHDNLKVTGYLDKNKNLKYKTEINSLVAYQSELGYNGRTYKSDPQSQGYHYYVPYMFKISVPYDQCTDDKYAVEHRDECCKKSPERYPEICCDNQEFIEKYRESNPDHFIFTNWNTVCCTDSEKYQGENRFSGHSFPTFYSMRHIPFFKDLYNEICKKSCSWDPNDNDYCCKKEELKNDPRCICKTISDVQKNPSVCCEVTKDNNSMTNNDKWKKVCKDEISSQNLSCKASNSSTSYKDPKRGITDKIEIIPSADGIIDKVIAGQGFNYDLTIINTTTVKGNRSELNAGYSDYNKLKNAVDKYNSKYENIVKDINNTKLNNFNNQIINFNLGDNQTLFSYDLKTAVDKYNSKYENKINNNIMEPIYIPVKNYYYYLQQKCNRDMCWNEPVYVTVNIFDTAEVKNTYTIKPYMYYISINKDNKEGTDAKARSNKEGVYATKEKNYENDKRYVQGGRLVYTKTTDKSGIHSFNISIKNGGITGKIDATGDDAYTCEYNVLNCIREGKCINSTKPYYFRPISLSTPFPNNRLKQNKVGSNWTGNTSDNKKTKIQKYITEKGDSVYGKTPLYSIKLDSETISMIKNYNRSKETKNGYLDWDSMLGTEYNEFYRQSSMLNCLATGNNCSSGLRQIDSDKITLPNESLRPEYNTTNIRKTRIGDFTYPNKEYE